MADLSKSELKGVMIGAGYFARFHAEAWGRIDGVRIVAVSSLDHVQGRAFAATHGIDRFHADWREMLDREAPDFVDIVTPPDTHEEICLEAARRGIHVVCQKPFAPTIEACERIIGAADASGVRLMVHENWRWQPWYREIQRIQTAGTIGTFTHVHVLTRLGDGWGEQAYLARQPFFRDYPRLLLYETGVHFIDTFRFLLGEAASVFARLRRINPAIRGEDAGQLLLTFRNGATALWDANRFNETEAADPRYTFGEVRIDATGGHLTMEADGAIRIKPLGEPARDVEYAREPRGFAGDCVFALQRHFIERLRSGERFESEPRDYLESVRIVDAAYESARLQQVLTL